VVARYARIRFGAVLTAEDGAVEVGARCVVMENALISGRAGHPARLGDDVLIGPHAHVNGAILAPGCFVATGAALFPGARVGAGTELRPPARDRRPDHDARPGRVVRRTPGGPGRRL